MSAPFRIVRPDVGVKTVAQEKWSSYDFYWERLLKMIPAEIIGLYLVGIGFIPKEAPIGILIWTIFCLVALILFRAKNTADAENNKPPDWVHVFISLAAFVIWIYTLGGVFKDYWNIHTPWVGSLMVLAWTFFVPLLYEGPKD